MEKIGDGFESFHELLSAIKNKKIIFSQEDIESFKNGTYVSIPFPVTYVKDYCFDSCKWLVGVVIPETVCMLGNGCFRLCTKLKAVVVNECVKIINGNCFERCKNLEYITIPESVISLGENCFNSCQMLKEIIIKISFPMLTALVIAMRLL